MDAIIGWKVAMIRQIKKRPGIEKSSLKKKGHSPLNGNVMRYEEAGCLVIIRQSIEGSLPSQPNRVYISFI